MFIGAAAIFARFALEGAGPLAVSYLRLGIAALAVLAALAVRGPRTRLPGRVEILLAIAGVALAIHFATWIGSLQFTSIAIATLLVCTSPIFTGIYDAFVLRRAPSARFWLALAFGTIGMVLIVSAKTTPAPIPGFALAGDALAVLGAIAMAAYLTLVRVVRAGTPTLVVVSRTYTWAALALIPAALLTGQGPPAVTDATAWFGLLAMALVSQLLGHTAINASLRHFTPTAIGFSTLLEPVIAAVFGAIVFGESLGATTLAGGLALLVAIGFAIRDGSADTVLEPAP